MPKWTPTSGSSNVSAFSYDPATRTLAVRYNSGHTYRYMDVDPSHEDGLTNADSVGKYLNENIKGVHEFKRG